MSAPFAYLSRSAKCSIPQRPPDQLRRPRLLDFLHTYIHRKLFLISAAAGYGKSTLLADFAHDTDYSVVWYRFDETDRDLAVFIPTLVAALRASLPALSAFELTLPALAAQSIAPEALARTLNREFIARADDYFVLAFDDFHLVEASASMVRFFDTLLADLPEQAHVILVGRTIPPLRLARLAALQQVAGLSEEHLRFRPEEVQALMQLRRRPVSAAEAEHMALTTEGWITGILLTTHALWDGLMASWVQAHPAATGPLYDYLAAEVLDQQPEPLRQFLLEAAILPEMEPGVCDAVLGRADSAARLEQAEARRLFITVVGEEQRSYQFHHLFHEFLLNRLAAENAPRLQALRLRAADWYAGHDLAEAAVTFYGLAGEPARAVAIVEANARALFVAGRHTTLRKWQEQLAAHARVTPRLQLYLANIDTDEGQLERAEATLHSAALGFAQQGNAPGELDVQLQTCWVKYRKGQYTTALQLAQTAAAQARTRQAPDSEALALRYIGRCYIALGQISLAEEALQAASQLFPASEQGYNLALTLNDLALIWRLRGQVAEAAQAQQQALALWRKHAAAWPLGLALNNVGLDLHMLGHYEAAWRTYQEALEWATRVGHLQAEALILTGQGDVLAELGDDSSAARLYHQAMPIAEQVNDQTLVAYLHRALARLDRAAGRWISALEWLRRATFAAPEQQATTPFANAEALRGIVLVEMGQVAEGRRLLEAVCIELEQGSMLVDLAQTVFFRAYAEFRAGELQTAAASLAQALALAERIGYDQMLLSEARAAREMLEAARAWPAVNTRAANLLRRAEGLPALRARLTQSGLLPPAFEAPASPSLITLHVLALGRGQVWREGTEITRAQWVSQRVRELFFFLIDHVPVARDDVLQVFWPDMPPARASANLRQTMYRLRRALGNEIFRLTDGQQCVLSPAVKLDYDVTRFETEARAALALAPGERRQVGQLADALAHYTGEYLNDMPVDWAQARRRALNDLRLRVLRAYADELMKLTRYTEANAILTQALAAEPLDDDLHEQMLLCLSQQGRRHEVVDHYRRYRETLRMTLGLDPPPRIMALYSRLIE